MGNSKSYLEKAKFMLSESGVDIIAESSIYQTEPWGEKNQKDFINQVISIVSDHDSMRLMALITSIEDLLGKRKDTRYGPRTIDIDILLAQDLIIESKKLTLPHPRMHKRAFTLIPLAEIAGGVRHPKLDKTIQELMESCDDTSQVIKV